MAGITTQTATLATIPTATPIAADQVGTATAPATGDRIQYVKLDGGAAGASSPVTSANPLPVRTTDGTTAQTIKAASTAAAAADTAEVVALSPNSPAYIRVADLTVTATAAANTALTLTIPAAGAGLFHYITLLEFTRTATAALAGTATLVVTSTNLPGSEAWSFGNAMTAGGTDYRQVQHANPKKVSAANTATTIVCPAPGAAVLWRVTAHYYTGP